MKAKLAIAISLLGTLAGCGTTSGRLGDLPTVSDRASAATVVVARISSLMGAANGYTISVDGKDIFGIGSGEHAEFLVPPGQHYIAVKCFGGFTPTWKEDSLKFEAKASQGSYFVVNPSMSCANIAAASQQEVQKLLPTSKAVSLEKSVSR